jgi:hypothetical protein
MSTWTNVTDTVLEPGQPIRSVDIIALKNNILAVPGGAANAPRVQTAAIQDGAVTAAKIGSNAVTTVKISDGNVTAAKIGTDAVTTVKILNGNVTTAKIADGNVTAAKISPPNAGNNIVLRVQDAQFGTRETAYLDVNSNRFASSARHLGFVVLLPGVIRCTITHRSQFTFRSSFVRIVRNGTQVIQWENNTTSNVVRTQDITVAVGDYIVYQNRSSASDNDSLWLNLRVTSGNIIGAAA